MNQEEQFSKNPFPGEDFPYEDILFKERPVSHRHQPMPVEDRAAQFAPFAALTGYDGKIEETVMKQQEEVEKEVEHVPEEEW